MNFNKFGYCRWFGLVSLMLFILVGVLPPSHATDQKNSWCDGLFSIQEGEQKADKSYPGVVFVDNKNASIPCAEDIFVPENVILKFSGSREWNLGNSSFILSHGSGISGLGTEATVMHSTLIQGSVIKTLNNEEFVRGIVLSNFTLDGSNAKAAVVGIDIINGRNADVRNVKIQNFKGSDVEYSIGLMVRCGDSIYEKSPAYNYFSNIQLSSNDVALKLSCDNSRLALSNNYFYGTIIEIEHAGIIIEASKDGKTNGAIENFFYGTRIQGTKVMQEGVRIESSSNFFYGLTIERVDYPDDTHESGLRLILGENATFNAFYGHKGLEYKTKILNIKNHIENSGVNRRLPGSGKLVLKGPDEGAFDIAYVTKATTLEHKSTADQKICRHSKALCSSDTDCTENEDCILYEQVFGIHRAKGHFMTRNLDCLSMSSFEADGQGQINNTLFCHGNSPPGDPSFKNKHNSAPIGSLYTSSKDGSLWIKTPNGMDSSVWKKVKLE